ncbi:helix-turn-helix domain-containing protein [Paracidovorax sp. MALMAid1276]|uniref:helix-turn-helix domain-containing protein n=1 Tax=Paracidovorax sp. MALMAid1276 TaxID=3411631 RepID=UPI003B99737C
MTKLGLTGAALAEACGVSKEAVSNWLSGESIPRPSKLTALATALKVVVEELFLPDPSMPPEPVVAFRMRNNRPPTPEAQEAGEDVGRHLRQLLPFMGPVFSPRHIVDPKVNESLVEEVARAVRAQLEVGPTEAVTHGHLLHLLKEFGAVLVPVYWGGDKVGHENAMSVYLPDSQASWVLFNVGCRLDDFSYWLAHELGHCLTLHSLTGQDGEDFAELFAQTLLFPKELARKAFEDIQASSNPMELVGWYAGTYGISVVTVMRSIDKACEAANGAKTGLATPRFYAKWKIAAKTARTASDELFGTAKPTMKDLVIKGEQIFGTPVFRALARWQKSEGGRSPAFVAAALNLKLGDAVQLSHALLELES